jgi:alkaline phosphatase D
VKACLEYQKSGDLEKAHALSNRELSPHVSFVDMNGHGYAVVKATSDTLETEFVCIPRPLERSEHNDGGPLAYRARHHAKLWKKGETPQLVTEVVEGNARFSV